MMTASAVRPARGGDVLAEWAQNLTGQTAGRRRGRLRFAWPPGIRALGPGVPGHSSLAVPSWAVRPCPQTIKRLRGMQLAGAESFQIRHVVPGDLSAQHHLGGYSAKLHTPEGFMQNPAVDARRRRSAA